MATSNRILTLDIGATGIKAAEFGIDPGNNITLLQFGNGVYDEELSDDNRGFQITQTLQGILQENQFAARQTLISISGQFALTRFVKLPPVSEQENRVRQIVEFEARQNVPFPMEEVVWDYQLIANPEAEELEVMFVVVKNNIVDEIISSIQAVGLNPILADVSSCATYNAARASGIGEESCSMVLDIGGRSTNLLFVDRNQFFSRTIPIAGTTITQQIAKELGVSYSEAEKIKARQGFVGLGGAYEDPASEVAAAVSKIIRGVMTRLHGEINRSITLYRTHQKGGKPQKLYLTGGSSVLGYTEKFFTEKLGVDVEYLNTFRIVQIAPGIDLERLEENSFGFSQLIGLALRYRGACPVEVNLLPDRIKRQVALDQKKPWLAAAMICILLLLVFSLFGNMYRTQIYEPVLERMAEQRSEVEAKENELSSVEREIREVQNQYQNLNNLLKRREEWLQVVNAVEAEVPRHLWFTEFRPVFEGRRDVEEEERREPGRRDAPASPFGRPSFEEEEFYDFERDYEEEIDPDEIETEERGPRGRIVGVEIRGRSLSMPRLGAGGNGTNPESPEMGPEMTVETFDLEPPDELSDDGRGPEQILLGRLQRSPMFIENEVGFEDYEVSDRVFNLRTFSLRAMLEEPFDLEY